MARIKLKITATLQERLDPMDYIDEFREANDLEDGDDVDQDALEEFAIEQFKESIANGDTDLNDLTDTGFEVEKVEEY